MRSICLGLSAILLMACAGCGTRAWGTYDGAKLIQAEFGKLPAENVTAVHCEAVLVDGDYPSSFYRWMNGSSPYRLEVLAPPSWVDAVAEDNHLVLVPDRVPTTAATDRYGAWNWRDRGDLWPDRAYRPAWFMPEEKDRYDIYGLFLTSIPYQVMWVDRVPTPDGRRRAFIAVK